MASSQIYPFGSGSMFGVRTDGAAGTNTPYIFGTMQEVQLEIAQSVKELYGLKQFPVDIARGTAKVTGKSKIAAVNGKMFADLFFNVTAAAGYIGINDSEAHTVPASASYVVTVTSSAGYVTDLGVVYASTGLPLVSVTGAPGQGSYSESAGVYTLNSADAGVGILTSYSATANASLGESFVITNQNLGVAPVFKVVLKQTSKTNFNYLTLNQCVSTKLSLPTKLDDYTMFDFEFSAFADASGNLGRWDMNQAV